MAAAVDWPSGPRISLRWDAQQAAPRWRFSPPLPCSRDPTRRVPATSPDTPASHQLASLIQQLAATLTTTRSLTNKNRPGQIVVTAYSRGFCCCVGLCLCRCSG
ncbi:uncharacterized protein LOC119580855 isoform X1 [Penaeus monodon]|uniref:uncharacterized protein LOC119580855 isoform X1 n=1 Tax=Penaeus monodon TaxID=6687 RepID=UPI0018A7A9FC|nr:uncharacterized protein LOC119580855 isoform X1 [Penaeus monodon]